MADLFDDASASAANTTEVEAPLLGHKLKVHSRDLSAQSMTKLIHRMKALALRLLPMQVDEDDLTSPVKSWHIDGYDENLARKLACEVLARKIVQTFPANEQPAVFLTRYQRVESDGDISLPTSALESAVDQHCPIFCSSNEAQRCTYAIWEGHLVQERANDGHAVYQLYRNASDRSFLAHFDPERLAVPRYQNWLKIFLWIIFLICYTIAIQTPEREFGFEDIILHVQLFGYVLEDLTKTWKIGIAAVLDFWFSVNVCIYTLLLTALGFRIADLSIDDPDRALALRKTSFYILSCAAPLIWLKLLTIFDLITYLGTLQIVVRRMLKESAIFFILLALLAIGFAQAITGLDASDSTPGDSTQSVTRSLIEAVLGSPAFDLYDKHAGQITYPYGMILYYSWSFATSAILLNVLVALFNSAYESITNNAVEQYMAFFTGKCIATVRAPDQYVYVAPMNLIEIVILSLEFVISREAYGALNRFLLRVLFFPALFFIAIFESRYDAVRVRKMKNAMEAADVEYDEDPEVDASDKDDGAISTHKFDDLVKTFPDLTSSQSTAILKEIKKLAQKLEQLDKTVNIKKEK